MSSKSPAPGRPQCHAGDSNDENDRRGQDDAVVAVGFDDWLQAEVRLLGQRIRHACRVCVPGRLLEPAAPGAEGRGGVDGDGNMMIRAAWGLDGDADEVDVTHLIAQVDPDNLGSMRVAEKCGGELVTIDKGGVKLWRFPEKRDMAVWGLDKPSASTESV
ncbi:hypothetical protein LY78DRAFT_678408 [Colletotrichum sublineola]|nr:hypothetical protein LY78DRAFT_678408 [Colletotrichum sublineola]